MYQVPHIALLAESYASQMTSDCLLDHTFWGLKLSCLALFFPSNHRNLRGDSFELQ